VVSNSTGHSTFQRVSPPVSEQLTMYESANCNSTPPMNRRDVDDQHTTSSLSLELAGLQASSSLQHHHTQTAVGVSSTAPALQSGVHGRGGMDLSMSAGQHHDHYTVSSSTSSAAAAATAAASLSRHPVGGNSDCRTLQEQLEYVTDLHSNGPFSGTNIQCNYTRFCTHENCLPVSGKR